MPLPKVQRVQGRMSRIKCLPISLGALAGSSECSRSAPLISMSDSTSAALLGRLGAAPLRPSHTSCAQLKLQRGAHHCSSQGTPPNSTALALTLLGALGTA